MSKEVFAQIRDLKEQGKFVDAWNVGYEAYQQDSANTFLRTSLFWVCYAAIKAVQQDVLKRQNITPNPHEAQTVNSWINCIGQLNLPVPCEELDYRFFNLFKGCGEHYQVYSEMVLFYGERLFHPNDYQPYKMERGEYPSLVMRVVRQVAKAWLMHHQSWQQDVQAVLDLLELANRKAEDRNKTWLQFDIAKCLVAAGRHQQARDAALSVLRKKMSEAWAWGALADTYVTENEQVAMACYCKAITEAHEPPFAIPMYFALAKIFVDLQDYTKASAAMAALSDIYQTKGWSLKAEHQQMLAQAWFDASVDYQSALSDFVALQAAEAMQYATGPTTKLIGVVDAHHRSGKGFSIYVDLGKKASARKGCYQGKGLPDIGNWVELNCVEQEGSLDVLEVIDARPVEHQHVHWGEGELRVNPKGFAFAGDAFVAPHMVDRSLDGQCVRVLKIWDTDPKKGVASWRAIKLESVD